MIIRIIIQAVACWKTHHNLISLLQLQSDSIYQMFPLTVGIVSTVVHDPEVVFVHANSHDCRSTEVRGSKPEVVRSSHWCCEHT